MLRHGCGRVSSANDIVDTSDLHASIHWSVVALSQLMGHTVQLARSPHTSPALAQSLAHIQQRWATLATVLFAELPYVD
jgi:hypothetical protein